MGESLQGMGWSAGEGRWAARRMRVAARMPYAPLAPGPAR
jgi:hypothetical protein